jgi:CBS domain containing-hemolysin-like protein
MIANIFLILLLIALNAFFVSVEFAAVASRRARLDMLAGDENSSARLVRIWLDQPSARDRMIAAAQLGVTIVSLALGAIGENTFQAILTPYFAGRSLPPWLAFFSAILPALPLVLALITITGLHVVLGEQVPKVAVLRAPERFALWAAPIMQVFFAIFKWFIILLDWLSRLVLHLFGLPDSGLSVYTMDELKEIVTGPEAKEAIEEPVRKMLLAVMDFGELVVRQVTVPRTEIIAVEANATIAEAIHLAVEHAITKLPVYEDNLDQITGFVHLRDLVCVEQEGSDWPVKKVQREALFVPETLPVNDLLHQFRTHKTHLAIILDEFGGTSGLVTLENLLEEIVGEVQDAFDATPPEIQMLPDGSALVDGMTLIDDINDHFDLELTDPNYDTIAGYILGKLEHIPKVGEQVEDIENGIYLRVTQMDRLRIAQVAISRIKKEE